MEIGYFSDNTREYIIQNMKPKRPLKNFLWNEVVFAELNQFCFGTSKACINKKFKPIVNDIRLVYIKDLDSGEIYDINRNFKNLPFDEMYAKVGLGYQTTESVYKNLKCSFTVVVPENGYSELHKVSLKNIGNATRKLSLYSYLRPFVNINGHLAYGKGYYDNSLDSLYYTFRAFRDDQEYTDVFYKASEKPVSFSASDSGFMGVYGTLTDPEGVTSDCLPNDCAVFEENYCGAMQFNVVLEPNEEKNLYFAIGTARNEQESKSLIDCYANEKRFEKEYNRQSELSEDYIKKTLIKTPDEYINSIINIWLKRQISLGKTWGRIYGKGFRDLLQDITGFVSLDPAQAKERLIYTLKHQFISGNGLRQFDPVVDYPYQDMSVWIPMAVSAYIKESGDYEVLNQQVKYYDCEKTESVFEHVKRGMDFLYNNQGEHGLNLWRGGDWNDSMNNCGLMDKGESVWLSIATVKATDDYIEILENCSIENSCEMVRVIKEKQEKLKENVIKYGFEKDHFIYGINDWGEKVGSYDCEEGKIYLNPQTWAVMAGIFDNHNSNSLMNIVEEKLKCDYGYMQNVPAYTKPDPHIGRVTYFGAGIYENGSVYNHGVMFKIVADCLLGRAENAYNTLKMMRYDNPANANSGVEPYAVSNMYFGPSAYARKGFAPCSWITGSAGWLYRAVVEYILGIKADFDGLKICPCLPSEWKNIEVERIYRGTRYVICYSCGNNKGFYLDGNLLDGNKIPLCESNFTHKIEVIL